MQRRARRLRQEPARELRVLTPPGVLGVPGPRGRRRRRPLEGEQQEQREQRGGGVRVPRPGRGKRLPAELHGRGLARRSTGRGFERAAPALEAIKPRGPLPSAPGWKESGSPSAAPSRRFPKPLGPSAPPHSAWAPAPPAPDAADGADAADAAAPPRRGAGVSGPGRAGRGTRGAVETPPPRESSRVGATPRPQPSLGTWFLSPEAAVISKPLGFQSKPTSVLQGLELISQKMKLETGGEGGGTQPALMGVLIAQ